MPLPYVAPVTLHDLNKKDWSIDRQNRIEAFFFHYNFWMSSSFGYIRMRRRPQLSSISSALYKIIIRQELQLLVVRSWHAHNVSISIAEAVLHLRLLEPFSGRHLRHNKILRCPSIEELINAQRLYNCQFLRCHELLDQAGKRLLLLCINVLPTVCYSLPAIGDIHGRTNHFSVSSCQYCQLGVTLLLLYIWYFFFYIYWINRFGCIELLLTTFFLPYRKHPFIKFEVEISITKFSFLKNTRICCMTFKLRDTIEEDLRRVSISSQLWKFIFKSNFHQRQFEYNS